MDQGFTVNRLDFEVHIATIALRCYHHALNCTDMIYRCDLGEKKEEGKSKG